MAGSHDLDVPVRVQRAERVMAKAVSTACEIRELLLSRSGGGPSPVGFPAAIPHNTRCVFAIASVMGAWHSLPRAARREAPGAPGGRVVGATARGPAAPSRLPGGPATGSC